MAQLGDIHFVGLWTWTKVMIIYLYWIMIWFIKWN